MNDAFKLGLLFGCFAAWWCFLAKLMSILYGRYLPVRNRLLRKTLVACSTLWMTCIATCATFPFFNVFASPDHPMLLYVVGDRLAPLFTDGDVLVTGDKHERIAPGVVVLIRNQTNGGFSFDGHKTPIRLRQVLELYDSQDPTGSHRVVDSVKLRSTTDERHRPTGDQVVPFSFVLACAAYRIPFMARPLRMVQWAVNAAPRALRVVSTRIESQWWKYRKLLLRATDTARKDESLPAQWHLHTPHSDLRHPDQHSEI